MNRSIVAAAVLSSVLLYASAGAFADAGANCGSVASAPAVPGTANEAEPRSCDPGASQGSEATAEPPAAEPPYDGALPAPSVPAERSEEIPEPSPQQ